MNLKSKLTPRMEEMAEKYHGAERGNWGPDYKSGYTQALEDVQGIVDELVTALKECDYFCQDQKARANQAIATDCPDCDYQCVGCIHSIDDCDSTSLKIRKALAKLNETDEGKV